MSLFSEIAGLRGENLSSAIVAHLLLRSPDARMEAIRQISNAAQTGPVYVQNQFAVFREHTAAGAAAGEDIARLGGRLDLIIETDDTVVGIENKFFAPFQERQPECYLPYLRDTAEALTKLRGREFTWALIILAPLQRENEIRQYIKSKKLEREVGFISWQKLMDSFDALSGTSTVDRFLIRELKEFVDEQIGNMRDLPRLLPHLQRQWTQRGTSWHRHFLNGFVWSLLHDDVKESGQRYRSGIGNDYYGWYLYPNRGHDAMEIWFGFMAHEATNQKAALVIAANPAEPLSGYIEKDGPIEIIKEKSGWTDSDYDWGCYEVKFSVDPVWEDPQHWSEALKPLNNLIEDESKKNRFGE